MVPAANQYSRDDENGKASDSTLKRFVTFYITNFPPQASNFFLRKGFEVCGTLEEVFVANNRNKNGEVFGFVSGNVVFVLCLLGLIGKLRGRVRV